MQIFTFHKPLKTSQRNLFPVFSVGIEKKHWPEMSEPINDLCPHHIETSQLICIANQLTGFLYDGKN